MLGEAAASDHDDGVVIVSTKRRVPMQKGWLRTDGCSQDLVVAAVTLVARGYLRTRQPRLVGPSMGSAFEALQAEVALLRVENASLREMADTNGSSSQARGATAASTPDDDASERGWDAFAEAAVMRTTLSAMCTDLGTAVGQIQTRLTSFVPDAQPRRVSERSAVSAEAFRSSAPDGSTAAARELLAERNRSGSQGGETRAQGTSSEPPSARAEHYLVDVPA